MCDIKQKLLLEIDVSGDLPKFLNIIMGESGSEDGIPFIQMSSVYCEVGSTNMAGKVLKSIPLDLSKPAILAFSAIMKKELRIRGRKSSGIEQLLLQIFDMHPDSELEKKSST